MPMSEAGKWLVRFANAIHGNNEAEGRVEILNGLWHDLSEEAEFTVDNFPLGVDLSTVDEPFGWAEEDLSEYVQGAFFKDQSIFCFSHRLESLKTPGPYAFVYQGAYMEPDEEQPRDRRSTPVPDVSMTSLPQTDPRRPCWFVGAAWSGKFDQTPRFLDEGIWENGWNDTSGDAFRAINRVMEVQPGDRIAIKGIYTTPNEAPFPNPSNFRVPGTQVKAIGVVTKNHGDGFYLDVDWKKHFDPPSIWYFNSFMQTIHKVSPGAS